MSLSNKELIEKARAFLQKAVLGDSDFATGGKMNPEQSNKFVDLVIEEVVMRNIVRIAKIKAGELQIDKIGVGKRVALPHNIGTDPGVRRGINTSQVKILPEWLIVPFSIGDDFSADNIEGEDVSDTIIKMMAKQTANDIEILFFDGNLLGPAVIQSEILIGGSSSLHVKDNYLALQNGILNLAEGGHIVDALGENISSQLFNDMLNSMPNRFKKNKNLLKFLVSNTHEQNYRNRVATRATTGGDTALNSMPNLTPFGIELMGVPLLSDTPQVTEHVTLTGVANTTLKHKNFINEAVLLQTLADTPTAAFIKDTDYETTPASGFLRRKSGGAITDPEDVKVTYESEGQSILTAMRNLILGIGLDITLEQDRDIHKGVDNYVLKARMGVQIEDLDAVVLGINIGLK